MSIPPTPSTEAAARQALEPQVYGDEFKPKPHPDIGALVKRIKEIDKRCTEICDKLYMGQTPDWDVQEDLRKEMRNLDVEKAGIMGQLSELYTAYEPGEGGGPLTGNARVIGADRAVG